MTTNELILYILVSFLLLITGSGGIFALIKFFRTNKINDREWEAQCNLLADLLEKGVPIPTEIICAVLRRELSSKKFANSIKTIIKKSK